MAILESKGISIRFGGLQALLDINVQVKEQELVGLIGPNGAGKTTFFNIITGFLKPAEGSITFKNEGDAIRLKPTILKKTETINIANFSFIFI